jgi:hypothetical protein
MSPEYASAATILPHCILSYLHLLVFLHHGLDAAMGSGIGTETTAFEPLFGEVIEFHCQFFLNE